MDTTKGFTRLLGIDIGGTKCAIIYGRVRE